MAKTFVPTLLDIVYRLCTYITRYNTTIVQWIPPAILPTYNALREACDAFLSEMASEGFEP